MSQVNILSTQMFPTQRKEFLKIYKELTSIPHDNILGNLYPKNKFRILLRTNILPNEIETVYIAE